MKIIRTVSEMQIERHDNKYKQVGFVPTMGYLHKGHLSLMKEAAKENELVIASIFVNPLQFGPNEDLETYPRDEARDIELAKANGVDILFLPEVTSMYPSDMSIEMVATTRTNALCGRSRPGHFDGVVIVLTKLFNIIQPQKAYFGLKDAQQVAVVDGLIKDMNFPVELIGLPTVREDNGLAKSSRNVYLTKEEMKEAVSLYNALVLGQTLIIEGEQQADKIIHKVKETILNHTEAKIDYVELLDYPTLEPVTKINKNRMILLAVAVHFKQARLIDNFIIDHQGKLVERLR